MELLNKIQEVVVSLFFSTSFYLVAFFLFSLGAALLVVVPRKNEIVIHLQPELDDKTEILVKNLINTAITIAKRKAWLISYLRWQVTGIESNIFKEFGSSGTSRLDEFINASISVKIEKSINLNVGVKIVKLVQVILDRYFSKQSIFVIVSTFKQIQQANTAEAVFQTSIDIPYRNSNFFGDKQPCSQRDLQLEMANFFLYAIFESQSKNANSFHSDQIQIEESDLSTINEVIETLNNGKNTGLCKEISDDYSCLWALTQALAGIERSSSVATIDFLQLIISLTKLKYCLSENFPTIELSRNLDDISIRLDRLSSTSQIYNEIMVDEGKWDGFFKRNKLLDLKFSFKFVKSFKKYSLGRKYIREGDGSLAHLQFNQVRDAPEWLKSYIDDFTLLSGAMGGDIANADDLLNGIKKILNRNVTNTAQSYNIANTILQTVITSNGNGLTKNQRTRINDFRKEIRAHSIANSASRSDRLGAQIENALTSLLLEELEFSEIEMDTAVKELNDHSDDVTYRLPITSAACYYARKGDYSLFKHWATKSVQVYPDNIKLISKFHEEYFDDKMEKKIWISELRSKTFSHVVE